MLTTPHRKDVTELSSVPRLYELAAELQYRFDDEGIPLSLYVGMGNHMDESLPDDFADGKAIAMNGTRYILVEMPFFGTIEEHGYAQRPQLRAKSTATRTVCCGTCKHKG